MKAVVKTGGKQYLVTEGQTIKIEKIAGKAGENVGLDHVLLVEDAGTVKVGSPTVEGAKITATIQKQGRARKIDVVKFKSKTRYRRKNGHRQPFTEVTIEKISH